MRLCILALLFYTLTPSCFAQLKNTPTDLLKTFEGTRQAVSGSWNSSGTGLRIKAERAAVCRLADDINGPYELTVEFTRVAGDDSVAIILPIGGTSVAMEFSSWQGASHGMARVDGLTSRDAANPTSVRPGTIKNGQRYRAEVSVNEKGGKPVVRVRLNGKPLIDWTGDSSRLKPHFVFKLARNDAIGLATMKNSVIFHRVQLTTAREQPTDKPKPTDKPDAPEPTPNATTETPSGNTKTNTKATIALASLGSNNTPRWEPFNGGQFTTKTIDKRADIQAMANAGEGDRGAYLKDVRFSDGVIEVDLKGANQRGRSFIGVVFHGVDGENYDAIYFRPFNFKATNASNRSHAVQYIAHPDWPWQRLRSERNGQFEKQAAPEPNANEWFHARIEVKGKRVQVFVNNSKTACLDVKKLNSRQSGKVGLWFNGIASFANLKITPAK